MIYKYSLTPSGNQMPDGITAGSFAREQPADAMKQQVIIRFLQQSASYLGANLTHHELVSRYLLDMD